MSETAEETCEERMKKNLKPLTAFPEWVPAAVRVYLTHTESGQSLRQIAREQGMHASTVLRQVRRFENRRDDPLIDCALGRLKIAASGGIVSLIETKTRSGEKTKMSAPMQSGEADNAILDDVSLQGEALRVLRRLCEPGAILAVAAEMNRAVVLREGPEGAVRLAVLNRPVAEAFALREWISCRKPGRVSQYEITPTGRAMIRQLMAQNGDADDIDGDGMDCTTAPGAAESDERARPVLGETPVMALARRRDKDGRPFLAAELVVAAERLREDYEIAQMGPRVTQNWEHFLTGGVHTGVARSAGGRGGTQGAARERVAEALRELGPGLGDMALRCCCYLEGLETAERRLGWAARSGKIVLRIALMRLHRHYESLGDAGKMIG